ncbi:hormone receptor 4 [Trichonephila inaurata madagascariensis]|uniref:Hormone receptor 4 n=1 Tax=Trichonephila inaurata madagascariensis TaxID=2747483 RepID=A0A8X7CRY4_9ARAC|nr:hormone receptor 4 [Trichonephila inaurata madagascariensis]
MLTEIMIVTTWVRTMSLFHDIKLKRRKIDTHCNSDGEINADVNTSSPESLTTDSHAREAETGSASGSSTTQAYLSEDGVSIASGSPPQLDVMCPEIPTSRSDRDSSPLNDGRSRKRKEPTPESDHIVNGIVESPQHERRNSVFDGGGERSNGINMCVNGREGLDLTRRNRRDTEGSSTSPSSFEDHSAPIMRMMSNPYKAPLVMGDIPGTGPGKTMLWSALNGDRVYDCTNSSPPNSSMDSIKQVSAPSPVKLSPISGNNHACPPHSPLQPQVTILSPPSPMSGTGVPAFPTLYTNSNKSSLLRAVTSYSPNSNRSDVLMHFAASSSRVSYSGRDGSPVGFHRFWPSNGLTNGDAKASSTIVSSSPPRPRTDSEALNLTTCGPSSEAENPASSSSSNSVIPYSVSPSLSGATSLSLVTSATTVTSATAVTSAAASSINNVGDDDSEDNQPMVCMICEDKATGLHYGIITCEGCKGFFKRTVQNKRVYTCVADGNCEITKAQRNRCQYCRFQKCLRQGMVIAAVREDRMPGGRNSGAVYNLYKVKYKKHKKGQKNGQIRHIEPSPRSSTSSNTLSTHHNNNNNHVRFTPAAPLEWTNGQILKAALTSPCDILQLRRHLESWMNNSRDRQMTPEQAMIIISQLIECDDFEDIAIVTNLDELKEAKSELSDKLCQIGDTIVYKLVQWTKRLPFYLELPVTVHTQLLSHKWHELLVLTTSAYVAIRSNNNNSGPCSSGYNGGVTNGGGTRLTNDELEHEVGMGLCALHSVLGAMVDGAISLEQLKVEAGQLVEQLTQLTATFRKLQLCVEEYVCLKVVAMLNQEGYQGQREIELIQERYLTALRVFVENRFPQQSGRLGELLSRLPEIQSAGELLLHTKMFFVPLFLNTNFAR